MKNLHRILLTAAFTLPAFLPSLLHAQSPQSNPGDNFIVAGVTIPSTEQDNAASAKDASTIYAGTVLNVPATPSATTVNSGTLTLRVSPKFVKAAYLGVFISPTDQTLQAQLKLTQGTGLVINNIDDKSPAQTAGLQANDIITLFADQIVINPDQFEVLVRSHKPGDSVELTIIREAQPQKISVTLTEKEQPDLAWSLNSHRDNAFSYQSPATGTGTLYLQGVNPKTGTGNVQLQGPFNARSQLQNLTSPSKIVRVAPSATNP